MDCFHPLKLPQGKVPCGKCIACKVSKQNDWCFRLESEMRCSTSAHFVTLTYEESNLKHRDGYSVLHKPDLQKFMKRLRYYIEPNQVRFFACGEYGSKSLRPHYHLILFNFPIDYDVVTIVNKSWTLGFTMTKNVNSSHIRYVSKYCTMDSVLPPALRFKANKPFLLCSRHPAIGFNYLSSSMVDYHRRTLDTCGHISGVTIKSRLPRYYKDKIFDDEMKAIISDRSNEYRLKKFLQDEKINQIKRRPLLQQIGLLTAEQSDYERRQKSRITKGTL